ncbi:MULTISPECIES: AAA family ATPase [Paraburkholderia]|uniref:AAA family ATPase n=1 Tax=Paraburkholderia TaxID=1822464 RepID=UPI002258DEAE|nr:MULTISPECIES: AAA family ATPase [Paraburkholderia]MCX4157016.1 AAA family ATPase [Paraburkholderia aspalathi]MDN7166420.1 AAA family ATPase [Paraburkholderia sp. SECH2]MDQ6394906.1 AAA family ATPase [Paraburkholderia aspalathi]
MNKPSGPDDPLDRDERATPTRAQTSFRLDEMTLTNVFGFRNASFVFEPSFNLIVGINGCGKTSLLQSIVGAVAPPINGVNLGQSHGLMENMKAVRSELREFEGRVRLEKCFPARIDAKGMIKGRAMTWSISRGSEARDSVKSTGQLLSVFDDVIATADALLPVVAFYSSERRWVAKDVRAENAVTSVDSRKSGYADWHDASADIASLQRWVIAKSLERLEAAASDPGKQIPEAFENDELGIVNRAVSNALPDSTGIRFDMRFRKLVIDWKSRDPTPFEELSDGQRGVCALVADIARRMCLLNPQAGSHVTLVTPGVVVIDELDMHLHPAWQRRIVGVLRESFPQVQFFAATHSPQVIGEVAAPNILMLRRDGQSTHPERSYGLDSNEVLQEVMGSEARNSGVETRLSEIQRLLDDDRLSEAQSHLDELAGSVGQIPEIVQLQSEIQSLRILGERDE